MSNLPVWMICMLIVGIAFIVCLLGALVVFVWDEIRAQKYWNSVSSERMKERR